MNFNKIKGTCDMVIQVSNTEVYVHSFVMVNLKNKLKLDFTLRVF
jgi:hypothetical protein